MSAYPGLIINMFASAQHACLGQLRLIRIDLGRIGPLPGGPAGRVNYPGLVQERAKGQRRVYRPRPCWHAASLVTKQSTIL